MNTVSKAFFLCSLLFSVTYNAHAQVGIGTITPQAALDVTSTTNGLLIPRMTTAQRIAIVTPAPSTLVFDTDLGEFYFYTGSAWTSLVSTKTKIYQVFKRATGSYVQTTSADVSWSSVVGQGTPLTFNATTGEITLPANKTFLITGYLAMTASTVSKWLLCQITDASNGISPFFFSTKSLVQSSNEAASDSNSGPAVALINTGTSDKQIKLRVLSNGAGTLVIAADDYTYAGSYLLVQEL